MLKLTCSILLFISSFSFAECIYCTSLEEALESPEDVTHLDLSAQGLNEIPEKINAFINLISLDLSDNRVENIDFSELRLSRLERIDFSNNPGLNSMVVEGIKETFPVLKHLNMSRCAIKFFSPEFSKLSSLEELDISDNSIEFLSSDLAKLDKLRYLNVSNNQLSEAHWLTGMWNIENLNISGNPDLNLNNVGAALLFKADLQSLTFTPSPSVKGIPKTFADLSVKELILVGGYLGRINTKVCRNESIERVTFQDTEFDSPQRTYDWVNRFVNLKRVEFRDMIVPPEFYEIKNVDEMHFSSCLFESRADLRKVKPSINISTVGTDIRTDGYLGNSKIATLSSTQVEEIVEQDMSEKMRMNELEPIMEPEVQVVKISAKEPRKVQLDFSVYDIPSEAFLTQDGQIYTGEVELKITEYKDPILNALAGVPMIYRTENKDNVFASSGMIDFRAYDDKGNELIANPDNIIQVEMDDLQPSENSDLYVYNEDRQNWEEIGAPDPSSYGNRKKSFLDSLNRISDEDITNFHEVQIGLFLHYKKSRLDPYILDFQSAGRQRSVRRIKDFSQTVHTGNVDQQWICDKVNWKIDTVLTDDHKELLLDIKKAQKRSYRYWKKSGGIDYEYCPRLLTDLRITPNFESDNYILQFNYLDSAITLPVVPSFGSSSVKRIQDKEKKNWKAYEKKLKEAEKEERTMEEYRKTVLAAQANRVRQQRMMFTNANPNFERAQRENLRFGLTSFGLVNCDYFSRNVPDYYVTLDTVGVDPQGNWVRVPNEIRNIYRRNNSYVSTSSARVPVFKARKGIMLFMIGAFEIAVIKGWNKMKNGLMRPKVERISIKGVSPDKVRQKIMDVGS